MPIQENLLPVGLPTSSPRSGGPSSLPQQTVAGLQPDPPVISGGSDSPATSPRTETHSNPLWDFVQQIESMDASQPAPPDSLVNGHGIIKYSNGNQYNGDLQNRLPHGDGKLTLSNGDEYIGGFVKGVPQGLGTYIFKYGICLCAEFQNGIPKGEVTWVTPAGDQFTGQADSLTTFTGIWTLVDGKKMEGKFDFETENQVNMKIVSPDQTEYQGEVLMNMVNGKLMLVMSGQGTIKTTDHTYTGGFYRNLREGQGTFQTTKGTYRGAFYNHQRHGVGESHYTNGTGYNGEWHKDERHGHGTITLANGVTY